ncbi:MAG: sigma-70 family RNA polymerase sigma factor [Polyangiales bacterium]
MSVVAAGDEQDDAEAGDEARDSSRPRPPTRTARLDPPGSIPPGANTPSVPPGPSEPRTGTRTTPEERERDRELVRRLQHGDQTAFRELFDRYNRRAFAVAFGVVRNKQDALDIVQDAFIKVHKHIESFQGTSSFYTWLYRIVMNLSIDHVRRNKKGRNVELDERIKRSDEEVAGDGSILPTFLGTNPRRTALRKELIDRIEKALDELPEYHRAVLLLREVEGLSYEEMAKVLEVPKGTIMSRLFHARRKMQESLAEYVEGELDIQE